jgi:XTP/dITP diphosphohydrolase
MLNELNNKPSTDILIATNNLFKIEEMNWFLPQDESVIVHLLKELKNTPDVEEDGETLEENAIKKALEISKVTDWLVFASDIGADIPGLGDLWDYRCPRRTLGEHATEEEKARKLIAMMKHLTGSDRNAYYPIALAFAQKGKLLWSVEFRSYTGVITDKPDFMNIGPNRGIGRMWYIPEFDKTEDQLTKEEHNILREKYQSKQRTQIHQLLRDLN